MLSITLGLVLVLLGIYFNSLVTIVFGGFFLVIGFYSGKSEPVREPEKVPERKTKHIVVMTEPPETTIAPWELRGLPVTVNPERPDFLPFEDYGYTDPLEKVFLSFPVKFLKKE